ncbi:MAG: M6 family metalloprotease domain-containing protein [Bacteroidales bacterium]|jgi:M6 family metalloprotease-like protein|nr:M6 family metalloprotease domain-containing protein [Bacteroidales bacterium]
MKYLSTLLLLSSFLMSSVLFGVPANPNPIEKTQPDGTKITVLLKGDEKIHWMETQDGYTLMYNEEKYIVFATTDKAGNMMPSEIIYRGESNIANIPKKLRYSAAQRETFKAIWKTIDDTKKNKAPTAVLGEKRALCILINFQDKTMVKTKAEFENLFNQLGYSAGGAYGSVRDFYRENSYGKMDFVITIAGPYTASKTAKEYVGSERSFAQEAVELADADIDYSDFANADKQLETFHILFAGYGDETINNGEQLWSHKAQLVSPINVDGVDIYVYSCSPELRGNSGTDLTHIGVICHELCHVFGAPDYYDVDYAGSGGDYIGTGEWDLMAAGNWNADGARPAHINIFQKSLFGWVNPVELTSGKTVVDMPNSTDSAMAYKIQVNQDGEMYILENMQQTGFNTDVPGHGLLIYHVHPNALSGYGDNTTHPQQLYPVCAGTAYSMPTADVASYGAMDFLTGKNDINSQKCPFPGSRSKTDFTSTTKPMMFSWATDSAVPDKPITDISENTAQQTVSFNFMGGNPRVATPTFSPANDVYSDSVMVNIFCAMSGVTIYYTTNGDTPSDKATLYVSPIKLTTPTTLKAIACKDGLENSYVATATYSFCPMVDLSTSAHTQDFESEAGLGCWGAVAATPDGTNADVNNTNGWGIRSGTGHNGSSKAWRFSSWKPTTDYAQYLVSPKLVVDGYGRKLSFYHKKSNTNPEKFTVGYSTANNEINNFIWGTEITSNGNDWALYSDTNIPFNAKYVAVKYLSEDKYYLYIDDVTIDKTATFTLPPRPECDMPTELLSVPDITTADLFWTGGAESYEIKIWTDGSTDTMEYMSGNEFFTVSDLTPATTYYWKIRAHCIDTTSTFTDVYTFTTVETVANEWLNEVGAILYPNPNSGEFTVTVSEVSRVEIFNTAGAKVEERRIAESHTFFLKLSGIYMVRVVAEKSKKVTMKKVVVTK